MKPRRAAIWEVLVLLSAGASALGCGRTAVPPSRSNLAVPSAELLDQMCSIVGQLEADALERMSRTGLPSLRLGTPTRRRFAHFGHEGDIVGYPVDEVPVKTANVFVSGGKVLYVSIDMDGT